MRPLATGFSYQLQRWHETGEICYFALPFWKVKYSLSAFFRLFFFSPRRNCSKSSTTDSVNTSIWQKITAKNIPTISRHIDFFHFFQIWKKKNRTTYTQHIFYPLIFSAICANESQLSQSWKWKAKRKISSGDVYEWVIIIEPLWKKNLKRMNPRRLWESDSPQWLPG